MQGKIWQMQCLNFSIAQQAKRAHLDLGKVKAQLYVDACVYALARPGLSRLGVYAHYNIHVGQQAMQEKPTENPTMVILYL